MISMLLYPRARGGGAAPPVPLVDYDFTGAVLPSGCSFSRSSTGTRFNASGVMVSEAINTPRFDYDPVTHALRGLMVERQSTNRVVRSTVTTASWNPQSVTVTNATTDVAFVDGTNTAAKITMATTASVSHRVYEATTVAFHTGVPYVISAFARGSTENVIQIGSGLSLSVFANINVNTNAVGTTGGTTYAAAGVNDASNGWKRIHVAALPTTSANITGSVFLYSAHNNTEAPFRPAYTDEGNVFYANGGQVEEGSLTPTSYIPTAGSAVTRAADVLSFTVPSGVTTLRYMFDDDSTQDVAVSAGAYEVPTNLNRAHLRRVYSV